MVFNCFHRRTNRHGEKYAKFGQFMPKMEIFDIFILLEGPPEHVCINFCAL